MKPNCEVHVKSFVLSIIAVLMLQIYPVFAVAGEPLELVRTILLQGVSGRIDQSARWCFLSNLTPKYCSRSAASPNARMPNSCAATRVSKMLRTRQP